MSQDKKSAEYLKNRRTLLKASASSLPFILTLRSGAASAATSLACTDKPVPANIQEVIEQGQAGDNFVRATGTLAKFKLYMTGEPTKVESEIQRIFFGAARIPNKPTKPNPECLEKDAYYKCIKAKFKVIVTMLKVGNDFYINKKKVDLEPVVGVVMTAPQQIKYYNDCYVLCYFDDPAGDYVVFPHQNGGNTATLSPISNSCMTSIINQP